MQPPKNNYGKVSGRLFPTIDQSSLKKPAARSGGQLTILTASSIHGIQVRKKAKKLRAS